MPFQFSATMFPWEAKSYMHPLYCPVSFTLLTCAAYQDLFQFMKYEDNNDEEILPFHPTFSFCLNLQ